MTIFQTDLITAEGRADLINWMHESKYGIETVFHNYPRILKLEGEERTVEHFKEIMGEIIEQPLNVNSDILNDELLYPGASIFHSQIRQKGLYSVVYGSFIHMQRCLEQQLASKNVNLCRVDPGIYTDEHIANLSLIENEREVFRKSKIDAAVVAKIIADLIITHRENRAQEFNIYKALADAKWKHLVGDTIPVEPESY